VWTSAGGASTSSFTGLYHLKYEMHTFQVQEAGHADTLHTLPSAGRGNAAHPSHASYQSASLLQRLMARGTGLKAGSTLQLTTHGTLSFPATSDRAGACYMIPQDLSAVSHMMLLGCAASGNCTYATASAGSTLAGT